MSETAPLRVGQTLIGPLFNEPIRVETVSAAGNSSWVVGLVRAQSERFRRVTMSESDLAAISILDAEMAFNGDGNLPRLGIQAYTLGIAYDYDPYFGLSISRVDPLPHQSDADELEEMEEADRERLEHILEAISLAGNAEDVRAEIAELKQLAMQAKAVETSGVEAKLSRLKNVMQEQGFFDHPDQRLLLFTEFKDTLDYLVAKLVEWGFRVGSIHGSMRIGSRDDPGSRLHTEQQFRDGAIQILVATEAAGEGINLQCCNILFNYDIPWNPNRLEQRMGRIHRYGQTKNCLIFNFVATNTIEGRVLQRLLDKLQEIRNALNDDAVFNVIGEVLPAAQIERVLRDYYAGHLGDADLEDRLLHNVDEGRFRAICQNALEGLASKRLNLEMLIERRAKAQERRVIPETIARFLSDAAGFSTLALKAVPSLPHTYDPGRTPNVLKNYERNPDWRLPSLLAKYPRLSTHRETADTNNLEWVTPGHPLFEAVRRHTFYSSQEDFKKGACFFSLAHEVPARIDFYRARVVDGLGHVIHERMFAVEVADGRDPVQREPAVLGDLTPAESPDPLPDVAHLPEASAWLHDHGLRPFLDEVRAERLTEVDRIADHVELSLTELLSKADEEIGRAAAEVDNKAQGAEGRMAQAETRHTELLARRERRRQELQQLTPNERRVAEDRRDCYWLYVVTHCNATPQLREPIRDPARLQWVKVTKVAHYRIDTTNLGEESR